NVIEMGPQLYGITKAAQHYFNKKPKELTLVECIFIASILTNPKKFYYLTQLPELPEHWRRKLQRYATEMYRRGKITAEELKAAHPFTLTFANGKKQVTKPRDGLKPNPYD
ncbi:MAG: transglycosylase domain-containing protein, partial [Myxococcales bacterium]|nr:transglycosylase domain-containing protein [Myxococcales bacterium]